MGDLPKLGRDLREMSFPAAIGEVIKVGATGVLELHDTLGVNRAYFVGGRPQGGRLARMKHPLGRLVVDEGLISEAELNQALGTQRENQKLLGQVLLELGYLDTGTLEALIRRQSQLNFYSLFSARDGRLVFREGTVHLTNFTPAPMPPVAGIYFGLREANRIEPVESAVAPMLTAGVQLRTDPENVSEQMPPAERFAIESMREAVFPGEIARRIPLPGNAVAFLLFALLANNALRLVPARQVPRVA
ncbi:MAG: hypothetical protein AAFX94_12050 [Myxococcota bacterium]